ncbi:MAG: AAA family ATPase [Deltaproteobacteria bacterium]|nr:AAA family ATPase [Deltaproteobacteria bacterium]
MYEEYFGFKEKPFSHTPNTKFLYLSEQHDAALRTLLYGIESRSGFMMLTGEVGSGKTTTIRTLLNLVADSVETCYIFNPLLNTLDLLKGINKDLGLEWESESCQVQIERLNQHLLAINQQGKTAVAIIDEAQNLSHEALEMVRMLSNLETESQKLLNIILVGQPELTEKLASRELRQLSQRIQVHVQLCPLSLNQTYGYIEHRLNTSGERVSARFEKDAIKRIFKKSKGIPRLINNLCDLSLLAAFTQNTYIIDKNIIKKAMKEVPHYVYHS